MQFPIFLPKTGQSAELNISDVMTAEDAASQTGLDFSEFALLLEAENATVDLPGDIAGEIDQPTPRSFDLSPVVPGPQLEIERKNNIPINLNPEAKPASIESGALVPKTNKTPVQSAPMTGAGPESRLATDVQPRSFGVPEGKFDSPKGPVNIQEAAASPQLSGKENSKNGALLPEQSSLAASEPENLRKAAMPDVKELAPEGVEKHAPPSLKDVEPARAPVEVSNKPAAKNAPEFNLPRENQSLQKADVIQPNTAIPSEQSTELDAKPQGVTVKKPTTPGPILSPAEQPILGLPSGDQVHIESVKIETKPQSPVPPATSIEVGNSRSIAGNGTKVLDAEGKSDQQKRDAGETIAAKTPEPQGKSVRADVSEIRSQPVQTIELGKPKNQIAVTSISEKRPDFLGFNVDEQPMLNPAGIEMPRTASASPGVAHGFQAAPQTPVQPAATQIAIAAQAATDGHTEIRLDPEELGTVRIVLSSKDTGIVVLIAAERPETLDLLRRNAHELSASFDDLGYSDTSFTFEQQSDGGQSEQPDTPAREPVYETDFPAPHTTLVTLQNEGMDLRV